MLRFEMMPLPLIAVVLAVAAVVAGVAIILSKRDGR